MNSNIFYLKSNFNQVSVIALPNWQLLHQVSENAKLAIVTPSIRKCNSASHYILTFGESFHIYKLIHIDSKPRILIA